MLYLSSVNYVFIDISLLILRNSAKSTANLVILFNILMIILFFLTIKNVQIQQTINSCKNRVHSTYSGKGERHKKNKEAFKPP